MDFYDEIPTFDCDEIFDMLRQYRGEHRHRSSMGLCGCGLYVGAAGVDGVVLPVVVVVRAIKTVAAGTRLAAGTEKAFANNIKVISPRQCSSK